MKLHAGNLRGSLFAVLVLASGLVHAEVCLYQYENFDGGRKCFDEDVDNFADYRINDAVSSLRIHGDYEVTLYTRSRYRGNSQHYTHDSRSLGRMRGQVSSMTIRWRDEYSGWGRPEESGGGWEDSGWDNTGHGSGHPSYGRGRACLYPDWNFVGQARCYDHDVPNFVKIGFDNQADSIKIEGNVVVTLYEHPGYRGYQRVFTKSNKQFLSQDHDNFSSMRIRQR